MAKLRLKSGIVLKNILIFVFCAAIVWLSTGCSLTNSPDEPANTPGSSGIPQPGVAEQKEGERTSVVGFYLDTVITLTAYDISREKLSEILKECEYYEGLLSRTIEGSDVWRINHADGEPVKVSSHTLNIIKTALKVSEQSGGAFDITIYPASSLWDFKSENPSLPDEAELEAASQKIDYTKISLNGDLVTLPKGMGIDLGSIAKGYVADELAAICRENGIEHAILNLGGNVIVIGNKPDGSPWRVGIRDPDGDEQTYIAAVEAVDCTVVTSGIYERGFMLNNVRYHHLLNPRTGWPAKNNIASTTIKTDSSMLADALSTACFVLGVENSSKIIEYFGVGAVFVTRDREVIKTGDVELIVQAAAP